MSSTPEPAIVPPPPGLKSDFSNAGYSTTIRDLCIVLVILNTLFTLVRTYTRTVALKAFGWDDAFCILAWIATSAEIALCITLTFYGFGQHIWDIPALEAPDLFKYFFVATVFAYLTYLPLKLTFLLSYLRIFGPTRSARWFIKGGIVVCVLYYFAAFWYEIFKCHPIAKSWDPELPGTCLETFVPGSLTGIFNVISDIYILVLPMPLVAKLNMSTAQKIRLIAIFSVGALTTATSIVRLAVTVEQVNNPDSTYALGRVAVWSNLEYSIGLMVACTLAFPAFWIYISRGPLSSPWSLISSRSRTLFGMEKRPSASVELRPVMLSGS